LGVFEDSSVASLKGPKGGTHTCPLCGSQQETSPAPSYWCEHCLSIYTDDGGLYTRSGDEQYNFTESGWFRLLGTEKQLGTDRPEPLESGFVAFADVVQPLLDRCVGQLIWSGIWLLLMAVAWLPLAWGWWSIPDSLPWMMTGVKGVTLLFAVLFLVSLAMSGYYWSGLMMRSLLKPYLFPSIWEDIAAKAHSGFTDEVERLLNEEGVEDHPGLLTNLGLAYLQEGQRDKAKKILSRAHELCPSHPAIKALLDTA